MVINPTAQSSLKMSLIKGNGFGSLSSKQRCKQSRADNQGLASKGPTTHTTFSHLFLVCVRFVRGLNDTLV